MQTRVFRSQCLVLLGQAVNPLLQSFQLIIKFRVNLFLLRFSLLPLFSLTLEPVPGNRVQDAIPRIGPIHLLTVAVRHNRVYHALQHIFPLRRGILIPKMLRLNGLVWIIDSYCPVMLIQLFACFVVVRTLLNQHMCHALELASQQIHVNWIPAPLSLRHIHHRQLVGRLALNYFRQQSRVVFVNINRLSGNRQVSISLQMPFLNQEGQKVRGRKFLVQVICIPSKATVQLDVHLTCGKIHHIIAVPDPAVFLDFLITDSDSIAISVLLNLQPVLVIPVPDIHLPVPNQARYHVLLVLALLVPLDHQLNELFLSQRIVNVKHG